jgi:hypothetical protein
MPSVTFEYIQASCQAGLIQPYSIQHINLQVNIKRGRLVEQGLLKGNSGDIWRMVKHNHNPGTL